MDLRPARSGFSALDQRRGFLLPQEKALIWPLVDKPCVHDESLSVVVWPLPLGQFRIRLLQVPAPEPSRKDRDDRIVRQLMTYSCNKAKAVSGVIVAHEDPKAYCDNVWKLFSGSKEGHLIWLDPSPTQVGDDDGI